MMKRFMVLSVLILASASSNAERRFGRIGWQFHEYDLPRVKDALDRAPGYGVDFVILSHDLVGSAAQVLDEPGRAQDLRELAEYARQSGIRTYLWLHELNNLPEESYADGRVDLDNIPIHGILHDRYVRLFETMPQIDGIVMSFHESGSRVFRNSETKSELPVPDRFLAVARPIHEVCRMYGKELILRNFLYEPLERIWFHDAVRRLPDDITVMCKNTPHEFNPYYPFEPMFGTFGARDQIMEIDLCHENAPDREVPFLQVEYIRDSLDWAAFRGVGGIVGRVHLNETQGFHVPDEMNFYAFSRFAENPPPETGAVWHDWMTLHYPPAAHPHLLAAFVPTFDLCRRIRYQLGYWVYPWKEYLYAYGKILQRSNYKWTGNLADLAMRDALYHPSEELFAELMAEKDTAVREAETCLDHARHAGHWLTAEQARPVVERFEHLADVARRNRAYTQAFFGVLRWMDEPTPERERVVREGIEALRETVPADDSQGQENIEWYERMLADHDWAVRVSRERYEQQRAYLEVVGN